MKANAEFAFSAEIECLTAVPENPQATRTAVSRFLRILSTEAPSLPATQGIFTPYAKVYSDVGHVELALTECDDPYLLPSLFERVQILARRAVEKLAAEGLTLVLANNNHSGLLSSDCPVWGDHENHLVEQHPQTFTELVLPFLVTRVYQGAGGVHHPTGDFLAAVRPICMELPTGGDTTGMRAIHSTAREEHHMGGRPQRFRYHLILADGHRSHYNLALQYGTTALAIKAIQFDRQLRAELRCLQREFGNHWVSMLRKLNLIAKPGKTPCVQPLVIKTQRLFLEAARRYAAELTDPPAWISRTLGDWQDTLTAYECLDRAWLSARLDAFAKYEFYCAVLAEAGRSWSDLPRQTDLFCELALLDHSYHEFCNPKSVFDRLESAGLLRHRVSTRVLPGEEPEPFVPESSTRARARARFIRDNTGRSELLVDWSWIHDQVQNVRCMMEDPFAKEFGVWQPCHEGSSRRTRANAGAFLRGVLAAYDLGRYDDADVRLRELEHSVHWMNSAAQTEMMRCRAWIQARRGFTDGPAVLARLYTETTGSLLAITDFCCVYRFRGLVPDLEHMQPWIQRGMDHLGHSDLETATVFRDHAAYASLRHGQIQQALEILQPALTPQSLGQLSPRMKGRILATAGEAFRLAGDRRLAGRHLTDAAQIQIEYQHFGLLADFTYASLAKRERSRRRALQWIAKAIEIQTNNRHGLGHAKSLLLDARLCQTARRAAENRSQIVAYRESIPALGQCPVLTRILENWTAWTGGEELSGEESSFWGL